MWRLLLMLWSSATNKLMYWKHVMSVLINWMRQIINTQTHRGLMIPVSFVVHSRIFAVAQVLMWWTIFSISKETLLRCWRIGGLISRIGPLSLISWNFNMQLLFLSTSLSLTPLCLRFSLCLSSASPQICRGPDILWWDQTVLLQGWVQSPGARVEQAANFSHRKSSESVPVPADGQGA